MMSWRPTIGPLVTFALAWPILLGDRYLFHVPNPGAITFIAVAFSAYVGGVASGLVSAAITFGIAAIQFSIPGHLFHYSPDNFERLQVLTVCTPAIVVMIGILQTRAHQALARERAAHRELMSLRAALDQSEVGVALLDGEMRAQFTNRAYRRLWRLPDALADSKPAFVALLYHARETKAYAVPEDRMEAYVAERTALIRAGDEKPVDIRLTSGEVIRSRCKVLADGGRMLTYGNVSDLVHSADEMAELALKDALTGVYNRRHFMARLDGEWKRYLRYGRPLSLLMLDIDHFKSINDRFGHDVGDQAIISVARMCATQTRDSDVVARIGGEEFAILLPETDLAEARAVAERLRKAVAERTLAINAKAVAFTVSIGLVPADGAVADPADLMKRADEALYAAKRSGRNRVMVTALKTPVAA
jgi:diguanylate cyclase (GGDEF)-like protein